MRGGGGFIRTVPAARRVVGATIAAFSAFLALSARHGLAWGQSPSGAAPVPVPTTIRAPQPASVPSLVPPDKLAKPGRVRLEYGLGKGTVSCDSEELFRKIFKADTDKPDPFVPTGPVENVVEVRFDFDAPGFRVLVELRSLDGTVLYRDEGVERRCADASDRAMLLLMLNVFVDDKAPPPPPSPPPAPAPPGVPPEDFARFRRRIEARLDAQDKTNEELTEKLAALQKALDDEKRKMDLTFALSTGALITANLTSNVGPGVWIGGDARIGPLSLGLEVRAVLPAPVSLRPYDFDVSQVVGLLTPCGRYSYFFGCAVAGVGVETHEDSNFVAGAFGASGPVLQFGGRLGVEVPFGESMFGARAWGEVLYSTPQSYTRYYRNDGTTLEWARPDVSAFFGLGLVVRFGNEEKR